MAKQYSPALQPWVLSAKRSALAVRRSSGTTGRRRKGAADTILLCESMNRCEFRDIMSDAPFRAYRVGSVTQG